MSRFLVKLFLCGATAISSASLAATCEPGGWQAWKDTQHRMISPEGRVIDHSDTRKITTSEGQSYAMFFALVDNDRALFNELMLWTQDHLAQGDLSSHLPAWLWGQKPDGSWGVLDENSASDSDLWIAYSLLEAGRLWAERAYATMGHQLLRQIAAREVVDLPGFGSALLPAPYGFVQENAWRLNPSYLPPQLVERAALEQAEPWQRLASNAPGFLIDSSPNGIAPDWISWVKEGRFESLSERESIGSYDAIRVYLWVGMLDARAHQAETLKQHFQVMEEFVNPEGRVAEEINIHTRISESFAGPGFSAALLPLFAGHPIEERLLTNLKNTESAELGYYNQMLSLFGQGWHDHRYRFDEKGRLIPSWKSCQ